MKGKKIQFTIMTLLTVSMLIGLAVYGIYYNNMAKRQRILIENHYSRAFSDMLEYTSDAEEYLLKALATGTPEKMASMLNEAWRCTSQAQSCLSLLPVGQEMIADVSAYLVQLGDIAYTWGRQVSSHENLTEEQYDTLIELYGFAQDLNGGLLNLSMGFDGGTVSWAEDAKAISSLQNSMTRIAEPFTEYPSLIYDGPFSDHMANIKPKGLNGREITRNEGMEKVRLFFLNQTDYTPSVKFTSENNYKNIKTYSYTVKFREDSSYVAYVDLTKQGGDMYSLLFYRETDGANLSAQEGIKAGAKFLSTIGFENMESSYYVIEGDYLTANYCYSEDGVIFYPDMVKVKVALDNGEVVGFEGHGYWSYHSERNIKEGKWSLEEASEAISPHLEILSGREAVIPNDYGGEARVYEYYCMGMGREFLVYIDPCTLEETEIFILIQDENGKLTV